MTRNENQSSDSVQVTQADWLKPGWLFVLKKSGGFEVTRFETPRGNTLVFSQSIFARLEKIRQTPGLTKVFMSSDDCALISEHFPEFHKSE